MRWKRKKMLRGGVVGTLMSNYGLEKFFKLHNIKFIKIKCRRPFCKRENAKK